MDGRHKRDEALERVEEHADPEWMERGREVAVEVAGTYLEFTTDHLWQRLPPTRDNRAMGALMAWVRRSKLAKPTDRHVQSDRAVCHARPVRVWRSLQFGDALAGQHFFRVPKTDISDEELARLVGEPGRVVEILQPAVTMDQVDALTREEWRQILNGKMQMVSWTRRRFKRMIRLLTEGRVYDDLQDDGRTLAARTHAAPQGARREG
jgi:hypothetical protein